MRYSAQVSRLNAPMDTAAKMEFSATITDVSLSGMRLQLREMLQVNERINITLNQPEARFGLNCSGTVRWSKRVTGGYLAGVRFNEVQKFTKDSEAKAKPGQGAPDPNASPQPSSTAKPPANTAQS